MGRHGDSPGSPVKILRTYILKELLQPMGMSLLLFTFVLMVGNLVKLADLIVNKGVSPLAVGEMFLLLIPTLLTYAVLQRHLTRGITVGALKG